MKKIKLLLYFLSLFLLIGCSHKEKEYITSQSQPNISSNSNSNNAVLMTVTPTVTPSPSQELVKNIYIKDNDLLKNLKELSKTPRKFDTNGEQMALLFLVDKMTEYGYQTQIQKFSVYHLGKDWFSPASKQAYFEQNRVEKKKYGEGKNVIITTANPSSKKTLYITAHYDTTNDTNGIRDNGSGVVVAMEIARQLKRISLAINVEFVFFSAEEAGLQGSAYFVSHLSKEEKSNALGCINIDVVGQKGDYKVLLKTNQGNINALSILMDGFHNFKHFWSSASDHTSFYMDELPAIYFADDKLLLKDTSKNPRKEVDISKLKKLTKIICNFVLTFNLSKYEDILHNGYSKKYIDLPNTKEIKGYSLKQVNKILRVDGAGSNTQYIWKSDNGNQIDITEQDSRFLSKDIAKKIQSFHSYNAYTKYQISKENNNIVIEYADLGFLRLYELRGTIPKDKALELMNNQGDVINNITLINALN